MPWDAQVFLSLNDRQQELFYGRWLGTVRDLSPHHWWWPYPRCAHGSHPGIGGPAEGVTETLACSLHFWVSLCLSFSMPAGTGSSCLWPGAGHSPLLCRDTQVGVVPEVLHGLPRCCGPWQKNTIAPSVSWWGIAWYFGVAFGMQKHSLAIV